MKILLIGKNGQVGYELHHSLMSLGDLTALDFPEVDLTDGRSLRRIIRDLQPNVIVNAAAYTDVDKAESEPEMAKLVNGTAPGILADEAHKLGAALIHYSSDYVYDGSKGTSYVESDMPNPINTYGVSKLWGDRAIEEVGGAYLILRTSWVYSLRRTCFVAKVLEWARTREIVRIVDDQAGSPTWARILAEATAQVIAQGRTDPVGYIKEKSGMYHVAGIGSCSRYEFAKAILQYKPYSSNYLLKEVVPAKSSEFPSAAKKPAETMLCCTSFIENFHVNLYPWKDALQMCLST